jgi:hypothetical protein
VKHFIRGINSVEDCEKYRYWIDSRGDIWEILSYCIRPTVKLRNMRNPDEEASGAIGCLNVQEFMPLVPARPHTPPNEEE